MDELYIIKDNMILNDQKDLTQPHIILVNHNDDVEFYLTKYHFNHTSYFEESRFSKAEWFLDEINSTIHTPIKGNIFSFVASKQNILIIDDDNYIKKIIAKLIDSNTKINDIGQLIYLILEAIIYENTDFLDEIEDKLIETESKIFSKDNVNINQELENIRKNIIHLNSNYRQLINVQEILLDNTGNIFTNNEISEIRRWSRKLERLENETDFLSNYSVQLREVYQAELDLKQNNIMRILTVITIITLPVTIISAWYGMNFTNMNELTYPFSYSLVTIITILITILTIIILKIKKYL